MLFIFVLSLFYLTHLVSSQTVSEGEAINKIISDILVKTEKKNAEPIQFYWKNRITADGEISTAGLNDFRNTIQKELVDLQPEILSNKEQKSSSPVRLQDIMVSPEYISTQPIKETIKDLKNDVFQTTNDDTSMTKSLKVSDNHLSVTRSQYDDNLALKLNEVAETKTVSTLPSSEKHFNESPENTLQYKATTKEMKPKDEPVQQTISAADEANDIFENEFKYKENDPKFHKSLVKINKDKAHSANEDKGDIYINIYHRGHPSPNRKPTRLTVSIPSTPSTRIEEINDIEDEVNSVPNYNAVTTESLEDFLKKMSKQRDKISVESNEVNRKSFPELPLRKVAEPPRTRVVTTPPSDLYLLVDRKDKALQGFFSLPSYYNENVTEKINSNKKHEMVDLYKRVLEIYGDIKGMQKQYFKNYKEKESTEKSENLHDKIKKHVKWEAIKKFFGHDRVCGCKCRANKPMCRVCAESDAVIRELTFEFNNLADYMKDHCTEIQTYFWKNPSGGKKLRDSIHKIDGTMHDYYKRVKGKCEGRTCKMFTSYLDKRQNEKKTKAQKEELRQLMRELGISDLK